MEIHNMKCPNCCAVLSFEGSVSTLVCDYCGSTILLDDEAAVLDRKLQAQSMAKERDAETEVAKEEEMLKLRTKEKIVDAVTEDPVQTLKTAGKILSFLDKIT